MLIPPRRIVLSGGGMRAVAHIGALQVLEGKGILQHVKEYIGVSAGAFLAFCLTIGFTLKELTHIIQKFDFQLIRNITPETMLNFPTDFGIDNGYNLLNLLHSIMRIKGLTPETTFEQLPKKIGFRCYATDIYRCTFREFSATKTPSCLVTTALRASMCLPAYFTPIEDPETGHLLIDGGVMNNYPLSFLTSQEQQEALGIAFTYDHTNVDHIPDIGCFFYQIFACYYMPRSRKSQHHFQHNTIWIPCGEYPAWDFEGSPDDRLKLIQLGEKAATNYLQHLPDLFRGRAPMRRYSVG